MLQPMEMPPASLRAAVGRLHDAGSAAGDHREAGLGQAAPTACAAAYCGSPSRDAGRAEHAHAVPDAGQGVEAVHELARMRSTRHGIGVDKLAVTLALQ